MTDILASLREKNPGIPFYSVQDQAFRPYGRVVDFDASGLIRAAEGVAMPGAGDPAGTGQLPDRPVLGL